MEVILSFRCGEAQLRIEVIPGFDRGGALLWIEVNLGFSQVKLGFKSR